MLYINITYALGMSNWRAQLDDHLPAIPNSCVGLVDGRSGLMVELDAATEVLAERADRLRVGVVTRHVGDSRQRQPRGTRAGYLFSFA